MSSATTPPATAPSVPAPPPHTPLEDAAALVVGSFLLGWALLLLQQAGAVSGGLAGVAFLVAGLTPVPLGVAFFVLNLPFYGLAVKRLGWAFAVKTLVCVALTSVLADVLGHVVEVHMPVVLATAFAGLCLGLGFLVLFRHRASAGGFGILAFHLQERYGWRAGYVQMSLDLVVMLVALAVVGWRLVLASLVGVVVLNLVVAMNHRPGRYVVR
ncbi:YitT family protein [Quadrisphaera granulorum]|uniref:YitT family protein n=1 Tax=Quadrisphaera granulorum TaxID=317664 RepID=UPI001B875521|nr:YitT family protein [Quadrisphaera granulorum]